MCHLTLYLCLLLLTCYYVFNKSMRGICKEEDYAFLGGVKMPDEDEDYEVTNTHTHRHTHKRTDTDTETQIYIDIDIHKHARTHTRAHTHTRTHTNTHTQTPDTISQDHHFKEIKDRVLNLNKCGLICDDSCFISACFTPQYY